MGGFVMKLTKNITADSGEVGELARHCGASEGRRGIPLNLAINSQRVLEHEQPLWAIRSIMPF